MQVGGMAVRGMQVGGMPVGGRLASPLRGSRVGGVAKWLGGLKWMGVAVAVALCIAGIGNAVASPPAQSSQSSQPSPSAPKKEATVSREADDAHRRQDIERHRQMAVAHEAAAACIESGRSEKACQEALREACKGIAVGRYCGMRH
jgi:hypothetical protein